ncbi:uncharacterized protein NECHADRAFT_82801 [Fusarium vanettenii 77-13-4]|uniref:Hydrophobin n=1 Tax=Fusarium vanettenii (strain ATCC MYA-4622 / CBS 123669 / FGSC 9596 / NRRL 45880 / 77-13-4) TaxID=660122 RepID=C7YWV9_FUSV7|nr:uncharacterized protein NECHADRAFT_82801 [Fusarium vanettenii 77-13-4]EEU43478.1 hypothetical protein NECHADRAFT_82801 [Fusarium vanettenii 77-13-4]
MKFTIVASALAMAVSACATGTGGGSTGGSCNANTKQVCCNGLLNCAVQVLGKNCDGSAYCCKTDAPATLHICTVSRDSNEASRIGLPEGFVRLCIVAVMDLAGST